MFATPRGVENLDEFINETFCSYRKYGISMWDLSQSICQDISRMSFGRGGQTHYCQYHISWGWRHDQGWKVTKFDFLAFKVSLLATSLYWTLLNLALTILSIRGINISISTIADYYHQQMNKNDSLSHDLIVYKSLTYKRNNKSPWRDPWGTPQAVVCLVEASEPIWVEWKRSVRYKWNQSFILPLMQ